ncbi:tyrosine-type recombinase/integrase [Bradyrhizobium sp. AC87j1]|uniref:tyrosine-type recombinase/integrase n=1 Tax=Bradyrhizobium sp. AC87j1 TaxID=2055894 RepID=UPI0011B01C23|nr:tyrosine-type recombinase/integrase [Bradyrhizobium sp. AC87j1]
MKHKYPKYTHAFEDHDGTPRFYLRVPGRKRVPLPGLPWSPEFMEARERALNADWEAPPLGASRTVAGTVNAALISYYQSGPFTSLAKSTQGNRRAILERFRNDHGDKRIAMMHTQALQNIVNSRKPAAQRNFVKTMRGFIDHCVQLGMIKVDPLLAVKRAKMKKTGGFHTWTEDEIVQYRERHKPGTRARLALELLLQTGHARSDVVRMGRQHVKSGKLSMRRQKTGVQFDIELLPDLVAELKRHPSSGNLAFLTTELGEQFTPAGFGNWFADRCKEAEIPGRAHGLRKASAIHHALNGATAPELMAWFGWKTITEAQRYIEEANRIRLAESAANKVRAGTGIGKPPNQFAKKARKPMKNKRVKS